jgi:hypothetical protein
LPSRTTAAVSKKVSNPILCKELEDKHPNKSWFDSYHSLNVELNRVTNKSKDGKEISLANLQIPIVENGLVQNFSLHRAVQKKISFLLGVEADWNPVTLINRQPKECLRPLWTGQLWLGGIKDSGNEKLLHNHDISAVVSIHPEDWLWAETCGRLFKTERRYQRPPELQRGVTDTEVWQHAIHLDDDSSSDLLAEFGAAFNFMDRYLSRGKNVLVHCKMGQSRSASLVLGYKMSKYHSTPKVPQHKQTASTASEDFDKLNKKLKDFTDEILIPKNEPNRNARRKDEGRRRGVSTEKFQEQLSRHLKRLAKVNVPKEPSKQPKSPEKKAGGGIIKDAILVLCFMSRLEPTQEILGYWSSRKSTNTHYWIAASKKRAGEKAMDDKDHLASFNKFFEDYQRAREQKKSSI